VSAAVAVGMVVEPDPGVIEVASDHFLVSGCSGAPLVADGFERSRMSVIVRAPPRRVTMPRRPLLASAGLTS
jgi:hypothetical protein